MERDKPGSAIVILSRLSHGGTERVLINVANTWSNFTPVYLITKHTDDAGIWNIDGKIRILECRNSVFWLFDMLGYIRDIKPEYVLSSIWDVNIFLVLFRKLLPGNIKIIIRESVAPLAHFSSLKLGSLYLALYRLCYRRCDVLVAPSRGVAREVKTVLGEKGIEIEVIENTPDFVRIDKSIPNCTTVYQKYIVSVGRLVNQKGYDLLIEAYKESKFRLNGFKLKIVGDGPEYSNLKSLVSVSGLDQDVMLISGNHESLKTVGNAAFYVLSSRYEGISNAMLEALALGVPVVATTRHTSADEIIIPGVNGVLVKNTDVINLLSGLDEAYDNLDGFNREKIYSDTRTRYSLDKIMAEYSGLLNKG